MDWSAIISGAISGGLISGLVTLFLPGIQWGIEKEKKRLENRREIISEHKRKISNEIESYLKNDVNLLISYLREYNYYDDVKRTLNKIQKTVKGISNNSTIVSEGELNALLLEGLGYLEREWNLV